MSEIKICSRCILDSYYPNIKFDNEGICNFCYEWDKKWKNFDFQIAERELTNIFSRVKKNNLKYHCLVPFSGGRDSSYVLYLCVKKYKLKTLVVTFNNGFISNYGIENMLNITKILGVDHILHTYAWDKLKKMYRIMLLKSGEFCSICNSGIHYVITLYQKKFNIPLVIGGTSNRLDAMSPFEITCSHPKYVKKVLREDFSNEEINDFIPPLRGELSVLELIKRKATKKEYINIYLPDYMKWDIELISNELIEKFNWKTPDIKKDHIDCKYHSIKKFLKNQQIRNSIFRQDRLSQLIRDGQISREIALKELEEIVSQEKKEPPELNDFLKTLDLNKTDLENIKDRTHQKFISKDELEFKKSLFYSILSKIWKRIKFLKIEQYHL